MRKVFTAVFICSFINFAAAQQSSSTLSLYYAINEVSSPASAQRIDSLLQSLTDKHCKISIYGYADFLSNAAYNLRLSQKRADAVKKQLVQSDKKQLITLIACEGKGDLASQRTSDPGGEAAQRRVDVVINVERPVKKIGTRENKTQEIVKKPAKEVVEEKATEEPKPIESLEKGESFTIEGLNFIPGRHLIKPSSEEALKSLLQTLEEHPTLKIEIQGHVCCPWDGHPDGYDFDTRDFKLSENRAKAVYFYLVKNGIAKERLSYKGFGHSKPKIAVETTPEEEQINRRVEIKVIEN